MIRGSRITSFEFCFTLERVAAAAAVEMIWPPIFSRVAEKQHDVCLGHQQLQLELLRKKIETVDVERAGARMTIERTKENRQQVGQKRSKRAKTFLSHSC